MKRLEFVTEVIATTYYLTHLSYDYSIPIRFGILIYLIVFEQKLE